MKRLFVKGLRVFLLFLSDGFSCLTYGVYLIFWGNVPVGVYFWLSKKHINRLCRKGLRPSARVPLAVDSTSPLIHSIQGLIKPIYFVLAGMNVRVHGCAKVAVS